MVSGWDSENVLSILLLFHYRRKRLWFDFVSSLTFPSTGLSTGSFEIPALNVGPWKKEQQ